MLGCKPSLFPMGQNQKLALAKGPTLLEPSRYRRLVRRLIYLTITRPELTYLVHILIQFRQTSLQYHWDIAMQVLRYLKSSHGQGIIIPQHNDLQLVGYYDSDWASCPITRKFISGYLMKFDNTPISWKIKKQATISRSSSEDEYHAMTHATSEILWLCNFLETLQVPCIKHTLMHCDNQEALHLVVNPIFHERKKHIEIDCNFIKEHIQSGAIGTTYLPTKQQNANIFTKCLSVKVLQDLMFKLGVHNPHPPT